MSINELILKTIKATLFKYLTYNNNLMINSLIISIITWDILLIHVNRTKFFQIE